VFGSSDRNEQICAKKTINGKHNTGVTIKLTNGFTTTSKEYLPDIWRRSQLARQSDVSSKDNRAQNYCYCLASSSSSAAAAGAGERRRDGSKKRRGSDAECVVCDRISYRP